MEDIDLSKFSKRRKSRLDELCDSIDVPQLTVQRRSVPDVIPLGSKKSFVDLPRRWSEPADKLAWQLERFKQFKTPDSSTIDEESEEPDGLGHTKLHGLDNQINEDSFQKRFNMTPLDLPAIPPIKIKKKQPDVLILGMPNVPTVDEDYTPSWNEDSPHLSSGKQQHMRRIEEDLIEEIMLSPGSDNKGSAGRPPIRKNPLLKSPTETFPWDDPNETKKSKGKKTKCSKQKDETKTTTEDLKWTDEERSETTSSRFPWCNKDKKNDTNSSNKEQEKCGENGSDAMDEKTSCCNCFRRRRRKIEKQKLEKESVKSKNACAHFLDFIFTCSFN